MEFVLSTQDLDPLPSVKKNAFITFSHGILNSSYKNLASTCTKNISAQDNHIFSVRNRIKYQRLSNTTVTPDAFLKFVLFIIVTLILV